MNTLFKIGTILLLILANACKENVPKIYMTGIMEDKLNRSVAALWVDSVVTLLSDEDCEAEATDVYVANGKVYVVGFEKSNLWTTRAILWIDGEPNELEGITYPRSVFVKGHNIYVAGESHEQATLWVNGKITNYGKGTIKSFAKSVCVANDTVYVVGWVEKADESEVATLWKNDIPTFLTDGQYRAFAQSLHVESNNVYIVGSIRTRYFHEAILWKNGIADTLAKGKFDAIPTDVYVSNDTVYVCGIISDVVKPNQSAVLWTNGQLTYLANDTVHSFAENVHVANGKVYVVGYSGEENRDNNAPFMLWKDGKAVFMAKAMKPTYINSIFIK